MHTFVASQVNPSTTLQQLSSSNTAASTPLLVFLLTLQDHVPHVQVAASTFGAISRAAERQTGTVPLQLGISVTPTNQVTALVQELDPLSKRVKV